MNEKVVREFYRIVKNGQGHGVFETVIDNLKYSADLYWKAYAYAGQHRCAVYIRRITVTCHVIDPENYMDTIMYPRGVETVEVERVTGERTIGTEHFACDAELSRYNPVNGWVVPEEISGDM